MCAVTSNRLKQVGILALLVCSGCSDSGFESSFVFGTVTTSLIREAQEGLKDEPGIRQHVDDHFGTPQSLKAWLKLPIDFGGTAGTIESVSRDDAGGFLLTLALAEGTRFPADVEAVHVTGERSSSIEYPVSKSDPASRTVVIQLTEGSEPVVGQVVQLDPGRVLRDGRGLYMRHCSHCHGTSGDGHGPTAEFLNPRPRDYRNGVFKFTSTNDATRASREDLTRIVKYGIPGTYMPSFLLMEDHEVRAIVEYVRFLAMRGEYERRLAADLAGDFSQKAVETRVQNKEKRSEILAELVGILSSDLKSSAESHGDDLATDWSAPEDPETLIVPSISRVPDTPDSRRRGRELYLSKALNCADCHGIDGAGNGPQTIAYEKNPVTEQPYFEPGLHDIWDNLNQPRNLQTGIYRGGRRPVDLFRRIHAGIKGTRMPSFKSTPHEDIWHVVNYVMSIPFESDPGAVGSGTGAPTASADEAVGEAAE